MRILITTESRSSAGGIEKYLQSLAPLLAAEGHELGWLFGNSPFSGKGIDSFAGSMKWVDEPAERDTLQRQITNWNPDVVYAQGMADGSWDRWLSDRYPVAIFAHAYFGACISGYKCHVGQQTITCQRKFGPSCLLLYFPRRCGGKNPVRMLKDYCRERYRRNSMNHFECVLVASQYMAEEYRRQGIAPERIKVLPLFGSDVEPDVTEPEPRPWKNCIVMVSRLTSIKGSDIVVEAVSIASRQLGRSLRLIVAGEGPGLDVMLNSSRVFGVETRFVGWLDSDKRNSLLRDADALVVPSVWPEPFGLVGVEAGCVGLPAVAFDVGGITDWLNPGVSGEVALGGPPTAESLANALVRALSSEVHHHRLRVNAWHAAKRFSVKSHLSQLLTILDQIRHSSKKRH